MGELVSIVTPVYNCAKFIAETINSVIAQTYVNWELIIVDDCSTDDTEKVVMSFQDQRIHYHKNLENSGAAVSRNRALRVAKGKWIAFLDSDDLWLPDKLDRQIKFMEDNHVSFSYTNLGVIDEASNSLNRVITGPKHITKFGMFNYCWIGCLTVMYDTSVMGLIQIADIRKNNDYAMWLKVIQKADCYLLNENLASYRIRSGSISRLKKTSLIRWHYKLFREAEKESIIMAIFNTIRNLMFGAIKKMYYERNLN